MNIRSASSGNFIYKNTLGNVDITGINIQCIKLIKNKLWIGTFNKGIYVYDMIQNKTKHYLAGTKEGALPSNDIFSIFEDSRGNIWIGSSSGLYRYDLNTRKFIALAKFNNLFISDIKEDTFGNLWIATYNKGAVRYNYKRDDFRIYRYSKLNTTTICYDRITYIFKDNRGQLWFASEDGGMCLYNPKADTFERFDTSNGLPSNSIYCIQQDNNNMIWLSTSNGIATFNPNTKKIIALYGVSNDLPTKQFNYAAGIKNSEGHILFGSIMGYVELVPERLKTHTGNKPVILTGFSVYESGEILSNDEILTGNIDRLRKIILNYKQNTFTINFSTLDFANEGKGFYKYMLDGYDKVWNYISNDNKVIYRNVQPGKYTFRILHLNSWSDKKGEETKIQIIIHPPFWSSWWAYCIYVITIAIILWLILKKIQNYRKVQRQQRIRQQEIEQEERLYQEKINFFISIAHEIRTPVTLINAPLEQLLNTTPSKKDLDKNLYTIRRNTERLQNLINQLLDFKKVEAESFRLQMKVVNMKKLLQSMITRFNPTTVSLSKKIDFECDEETVLAQVDEEAITKIISNLLTNAIKYGEKYIKVSLASNISTNNMCISVRNDGEIIPEEMRDKIFEAFVQIKDKSHIAQGTGLGLALTKSLVNLHSGTIRIDDKADDNCFIVEIPLNIDSSIYCKDGVLEEEKLNKMSLQPETVRKNTLLIVEDDLEMRTFLSDQLSMKYNIIEAENGKVALEMVKKIKINIILSDVVMPEMTGLELCSEIKSNISTCNIPIILLTAKATLIDKIEGLEKGADSYIEKPFSMKHLIVQIDTLIANQKKVRQNFADAPLRVFNDISTNDKDREFIDSITNIIVNFMHEEDFSVDSLADHLNMSRSKLHRKIKIITGQTPNELIRIVRMNKAAEFLASGNYRISEVCTKIGVQSLSHFTKSFVKQFGILPKDFVKEV